jgi:hypothetical protein
MPLYVTIGPEERATVGYILSDSDAFELQLYHRPNNLPGRIPAGQPTRLEFVAVSDTAQSNPITLEVAWDGKWAEGSAEMQRHFVVRQVSA